MNYHNVAVCCWHYYFVFGEFQGSDFGPETVYPD
jgi:hypothetical protein